MPNIMINDCNYYYEEHGTGAHTIVFAHGLLLSGRVFHNQLVALRDRFRCILIDLRGQGRSGAPERGYGLNDQARDIAQLLEVKGFAPCHFVGLSMGGFIGLRLAIVRPELLRSLTLIGSSADEEARENLFNYRLLNLVMRTVGPRPIAKRVMRILFGEEFLGDPDMAEAVLHWRRELLSIDRRTIGRAVKAVLGRESVYSLIHKIETPTIIIVGEQDVATPPTSAERMHGAISESRLIKLPRVGHTAPVEAPGEVNDALAKFFSALPIA